MTDNYMHEIVKCNACGCSMTRGGLITHRCAEKNRLAAEGHALIQRINRWVDQVDPEPF